MQISHFLSRLARCSLSFRTETKSKHNSIPASSILLSPLPLLQPHSLPPHRRHQRRKSHHPTDQQKVKQYPGPSRIILRPLPLHPPLPPHLLLLVRPQVPLAIEMRHVAPRRPSMRTQTRRETPSGCRSAPPGRAGRLASSCRATSPKRIPSIPFPRLRSAPRRRSLLPSCALRPLRAPAAAAVEARWRAVEACASLA